MKFVRLVLTGSILTMVFQACTPHPTSAGEDERVTALAATISAIQGTVSAMQTLPIISSPIYIPTVTPARRALEFLLDPFFPSLI